MAKLTLAVFLLFVAYAACDLYMHNPRGSNDRLDEANANRDNADRLFDSQNNAKGGYCIGPQMTYYEGSLLSVEWTNQHGCGSNPKLVCNIVLQYMCGRTDDDGLHQIRDGTTTTTIPEDEGDAVTKDGDVFKYGMHENWQSWTNCKTRNRNMGLYIADRESEGGLDENRASARFTRQNNNGERHGYECAEERDYYPYWHPTQWRDIAIMAHSKDYCPFYQSESQNVKKKGYCTADTTQFDVETAENNPADCTSAGNTWVEAPSFGLNPPDCVVVPWSRENHLGNGADGFQNRYNMTFPSLEDMKQFNCIDQGPNGASMCVCVIRLRYNISTVENGFPDMSRPDAKFIDWTYNGDSSAIKQDPIVNYTDPSGNQYEIQMAVDTTQFGRTFQDRSHTFIIAKRPNKVPRAARLYNLNVRGKRGNIVQAYPATEYDFVPQYLYVRVGDYIHFQWTGCDQNPAGNAGEGTQQTDRTNIAQIENAWASVPITEDWAKSHKKQVLFQDPAVRFRFQHLDQTGCKTQAELEETENNNDAQEDPQNCGKLNAADQHFDGGVFKMNLTGTFHYMNTRNHNFSNRDQKGIIYVTALLPNWAVAVVVVGAILFAVACATAFLMFYAKSHPHSAVANVFSKM